ncbi:hypothetical protein FOPG_18606 [Fusarium oxysporum f. sp. conglutinans race 2 54008]|uniref:Uncharacterized protein n=2 Tax=Fusarium oxysporum f. sp. conglutinans TaxID=100902 RepID=X0GZA2_FUSOX|nr:hypothetical protein FOPG_18606 [Fusarium oxysporum f. sp. conglutinans race 2 54008]KAG7000497.1 hypothetical protein FocnCong_v013176 [Fusarium oxysporum f. sp. conglutinans]KAH7463477.1 hypothetical protein FOMA001_g18105 [Fusarium oxysporum f. sp. matthiolae]
MPQLFLQSRAVTVSLAVLPALVSIVVLLRFSRNVSNHTSKIQGRIPPDDLAVDARDKRSIEPPQKPYSLPPELNSEDSEWVVAYERVVSQQIPTSALKLPVTIGTNIDIIEHPSPLMTAYSRATQLAFASTPQAFLMRLFTKDAQARRTFGSDWIQRLAFSRGDVVNGAYKVTYHGPGKVPGSERIELMIEAPPSYEGYVPRGLILSEMVFSDEHIVTFVNETWMWRRRDEVPTLVETPFGSWFHSLVASWLVINGVRSVMFGSLQRS